MEVGRDGGVLSRYPATQPLRKKLLLKGRDYYEKLIADNPSAMLTPRLARAKYELAAILGQLSGDSEKAIGALKDAIEAHQQLARQFPKNPQYQTVVAGGHTKLGAIYSRMGNKKLAAQMFARAISLFDAMRKDYPESRPTRENLARALNNHGDCLNHENQFQDARKSLDRAIAIYNQLAQEDPSLSRYKRGLASCQSSLATALDRTGEPDDALVAFQQSISVSDRLARQNPEDVLSQRNLADCLNSLGGYYASHNQLDRAMQALQRSLKIRAQIARDNPQVLEYQLMLQTDLWNHGVLLRRKGKFQEALPVYQQMIELLQRLVRDNPDHWALRKDLAMGYEARAKLFRRLRRPKKALAEIRKALSVREALARRHPKVAAYDKAVADTHITIFNHWHAVGDLRQAVEASRPAEQVLIKLVRDDPAVVEYRMKLAYVLSMQGFFYGSTGRPLQGIDALRRAIKIRQALPAERKNEARLQDRLASDLARQGALQVFIGESNSALTSYHQALEIREYLVGKHPAVIRHSVNLAGGRTNVASVLRLSQPQKALELLQQAATSLEAVLDREPDHRTAKRFLKTTYHYRALTYRQLNRHRDAVECWRLVLACEQSRGVSIFHLQLGFSLVDSGQHSKAVVLADKKLKLAPVALSAFRFAGLYAYASQAVQGDVDLTSEARTRLADAYAGKATQTLKKLARSGFFKSVRHRGDLVSNKDFKSLHPRAEFRAFATSIGVQLPAWAMRPREN